MSSNNKRGVMMRTLLTSNYGGCGGCGKPKPSQVHQPTPKPNPNHNNNNNTAATTTTNPTTTTSLTSSTTSTGDDDDVDLLTSTTVSEESDTHHQDQENKKKNNKIVEDSVAVEKESKDPYRDFRYSMLQMIFEKKIFSESGLEELLQCFLELNAPCHHHVIVQVFMEICQHTFPKKLDGGGGGEPSSS